MDGYRGAVERGRGRGLSRIRAEIDRYNHEISNIRREGEGEGKYEEEEDSAWDSAESGVGSPKSLVLVEEGGSKCKIRCQSSAIRISATTVFTANRGDLIYTNPNFPESARETTTKAWQSQSHEGGGEPLEALPEPLYADKFNSTQINLQTAGGEPLEALSEPLYADKFNSTEINLQTAGGVPLEALSEPLYADKSNSAQIDLRTAAPSSFPNELPCTESRAPHIYSFKDSAVAMSMASKIKSILERVDVRVHGSQVQTDAGNYSCTSHPAQLRSLSKTNNAVLQMVTDPESFHNTLENMHTSEQYLIPFTDHQWFETQLKEIKEEPRSNEIPDPKLYLERIVAALSRKDQIGYLDQYKCSTTKGTASSLKSSCTSVVHERSNVCNHQETKYYKSSATIYDPKKDTHLPTLSTGTGHHKNILQVFKEDEDSDSKPVHMLDCQDSATLPTYSDKNIQVNRAEDKENDKTEESGCQTLPSYPQALCCSTYEQINTNPMSDLSCDVKQTYRDGCHCNDQFPKESQQKVVNLLEGCQLLEKNFVGAKPHQHLQQVPRLLPERKQNESLDDETQVANRAVAAAGLANELEVLMATGKDPRILKKPVQQEEEIHHSKLDLPVETAAKAACQSARDLIKEPMWKGPQTKPVQKNPQIKLRQRSVTQEEKPLAAKKIAGNLIGEMFDYDLMYQRNRRLPI